MRAEERLVWDIAYWNPNDKVTEQQLEQILSLV